jgi:hypothetical protein
MAIAESTGGDDQNGNLPCVSSSSAGRLPAFLALIGTTLLAVLMAVGFVSTLLGVPRDSLPGASSASTCEAVRASSTPMRRRVLAHRLNQGFGVLLGFRKWFAWVQLRAPGPLGCTTAQPAREAGRGPAAQRGCAHTLGDKPRQENTAHQGLTLEGRIE